MLKERKFCKHSSKIGISCFIAGRKRIMTTAEKEETKSKLKVKDLRD